MDNSVDTFLDRLDAFAAELSPTEQAMLRALIGEDSDTDGFAMDPPWTASRSLIPSFKLQTIDDIASGGIANGDLGSGRISGTDLGSGR